MDLIRDASVHLVITSPPYWQLKDYGNDGQIGFDDSYEDYINNLNLVWNECCRVLEDGCLSKRFRIRGSIHPQFRDPHFRKEAYQLPRFRMSARRFSPS